MKEQRVTVAAVAALAGVLSLSAFLPCSANEGKENGMPAKCKACALRVVAAMFLDPDVEELSRRLSDDMTTEDDRRGTAKQNILKEVGGPAAKIPQLLRLREIIFFGPRDIPALKQRFGRAKRMWESDRAGRRSRTSFACLVVLDIAEPEGKTRRMLQALYFGEFDGLYKVTHLDSNN